MAYQPIVLIEKAFADKDKNIRGRDIKSVEWHNPIIVHEVNTGPMEGYKIAYLNNAKDTAQLGRLSGHCAGTHFIYTCELDLWQFFAVLEPNGKPVATLHSKTRRYIEGDHEVDGRPAYPDEVQRRLEGIHGYPSFDDVVTAFKAAGLKYEPGKYRNNMFNLRTYHISKGARDYDDLRDPAQTIRRNIAMYEKSVHYYERNFKIKKDLALGWGPLGPDNPFKPQMDLTNRLKAQAQQQIIKLKQDLVVVEVNKPVDKEAYFSIVGSMFMFRRKIRVVASLSSKGHGEPDEPIKAIVRDWMRPIRRGAY